MPNISSESPDSAMLDLPKSRRADATDSPDGDRQSVQAKTSVRRKPSIGDTRQIVESPAPAPSSGEASEEGSSGSAADGETIPRRRRRGSRGGKGRNAAARAARAARAQEQQPVQPDDASVSSASGGSGAPVQSTSDAQPKRSTFSRKSDGGTSAGASGAERVASPSRLAPRQSRLRSASVTDDAKSMKARKATHVRVQGDKEALRDETNSGLDDESVNASPNEDEGIDVTDAATGETRKPRRRRGGRGRGAAKRSSGEVKTTSEPSAIQLDAKTLAKRRGKERNGRPVGRYFMCVQKRDAATQIAVLEGRNLIEHYVSRPNDDISQIHGNIYLSRVQNVLPGMEAAFIDVGTPKNAVLYRGDVRYDPDELAEGSRKQEQPRIEQMIKAGQVITCQVTKNPIGLKGARLTQEVSLPGRFVVLMPNSTTYGISKRLPDDERRRLRRILDSIKPAEHGLIVRTAAEGATADELRRDVQRLLKQWDEIEKKARDAKAPKLLYREPDMAVRMIREEFNKNYRGVVIDDRELYEEVREYVTSISPELADRIEYFDRDAEPLPLFERYHVHEQLHKAIDRKVWLPSGGSLIIERTEALTVIDVNTGKNVGKSNLEETVYRNNLEAAEEIARQLRLRDIGGIIVIDFIDMEVKANRDEVLQRLRDALARDKTRTQAYPIGELGLVEMTRKRISEGLVESLSEMCESCHGRGLIIDSSLLVD